MQSLKSDKAYKMDKAQRSNGWTKCKDLYNMHVQKINFHKQPIFTAALYMDEMVKNNTPPVHLHLKWEDNKVL